MNGRFRIACIQTSSGDDLAANLASASALVREARGDGADLMALPECVALMEPRRRRIIGNAAPEVDHPALAAFQALARETGAWLLVGSLTVKVETDRVANRSYLLDKDGAIIASYDKIHMFDVDLPGGESYRESSTYRAGDQAVLAETTWAPVGLTVCYDLRFPALYRALAHGGAQILTVPSAFTAQTGRAHWHVLLRARAIETGCYVVAPAQCGTHPGGRETYGHSLIVDPWGAVIAEAGEETGFIAAEIDPEKVVEARRALPSLTHDRSFAGIALPGQATQRLAGE